MGGLAAHDGAQADDGLESPRSRDLLRHERQLEGARHTVDFDVVRAGAVAQQAVNETAHL